MTLAPQTPSNPTEIRGRGGVPPPADHEPTFDALPQPLAVLDQDLRVVKANRAFRRLFDVPAHGARGRSIQEIWAGDPDMPRLAAALVSVFRGTSEQAEMEIGGGAAEPGRRRVRLRASRIEVDPAAGDPVVLLAVDERADRAHRDPTRPLREQELTLLHQILIAASEYTDVPDLLQYTLDRVCSHLQWPIGHAWLVPRNEATLASSRIWHLEDVRRFGPWRSATETLRFARGEGIVGWVFASGRPIWIADSADPEHAALYDRAMFDRAPSAGIRAGLAVPILVESEVVGVIEFFTGEPAPEDETFLGVVCDIGALLGRVVEHKHAQDALRAANATLERRIADRTGSLEETKRELEAFTYSAAHDLRGPLRAINGFSHLLLETYASVLDDKARRYLHLVQANAERMGRLIDDLLLFSRFGRQALMTENVAPAGLVREVLDQLSAEGDDRHVDFLVRELPVCHADPHLLKQVFINLLSNALKFTRPQPHAQIEIGWCDPSDTLDTHTYFVRDNGVGFDMQYAHKLFGVFERLHRDEEFEGTGVGLAIVQRIIDRHGGRVWAEGRVGAGATFYFSLPRGLRP